MGRMAGRAAVVVLALAGGAVRAGVVFDRTVAEVGEVRSGQPLTETFSFRNEGPGEVEVVGLRTGCGCLKPVLEKRCYAAGEGGQLRLEVHTLSQGAGPHAWPLVVTVRDAAGQVSETGLEVRGRVVAEVTVEPPVLTLFAGAALAHPMTVTDRRGTPLTVTAVESTCPHLAGRVQATEQNGQGHRVVRLALALAADCPEGRHEGTLTVRTDDPAYRELKVPVTVVKRPRQSVTASPASVSLPAARGGPASRIVLLRPAGKGAVRVEGVQADDPALTVTWAEGPGELATLKVAVGRLTAADRSPGPRKSAVHVRLSAPARETVTVPVTVAVE